MKYMVSWILTAFEFYDGYSHGGEVSDH